LEPEGLLVSRLAGPGRSRHDAERAAMVGSARPSQEWPPKAQPWLEHQLTQLWLRKRNRGSAPSPPPPPAHWHLSRWVPPPRPFSRRKRVVAAVTGFVVGRVPPAPVSLGASPRLRFRWANLGASPSRISESPRAVQPRTQVRAVRLGEGDVANQGGQQAASDCGPTVISWSNRSGPSGGAVGRGRQAGPRPSGGAVGRGCQAGSSGRAVQRARFSFIATDGGMRRPAPGIKRGRACRGRRGPWAGSAAAAAAAVKSAK
jgi:hypothetical protein